MADERIRTLGINALLLRPFRLTTLLAAVALAVSLGFLAYVAARSVERLDPLEQHLAHLEDLQQSSVDIQEILIHSFEEGTPPRRADIDRLDARLLALLRRDTPLHPKTSERIRRALGFLQTDAGDPKTGLLAALALIREASTAESALQRTIVIAARRSAETEVVVAGVALLATPLLALSLLAAMRRRLFRSVERLSDLLENVGNQDFRPTAPVGDRSDPLAVVFDRYNGMAEKLEVAQRAALERATSLENQVRAASETLLRQQAELEHGAQLAALGEFAARLAHELRNPISGISFALRNLEVEVEDPDRKERIALIADEMDRVTRLLEGQLELGRARPESPVRVDTRALVEDVVRLFAYQLPERIVVACDVEAAHCLLPRDTIRQVLINLLRNSRDAIGEAGGRISVAMERIGATARLTVGDDGPGYPEDLLRDGIRPFRSDKASGTGLGLSIVRRLVEAAGGDLALKRADGGGAVTVVTLPCRD